MLTDTHLASILGVLSHPVLAHSHSRASGPVHQAVRPATPARMHSLPFALIDAKQMSDVTTASRGQSCPEDEAQVVETYECLLRSGRRDIYQEPLMLMRGGLQANRDQRLIHQNECGSLVSGPIGVVLYPSLESKASR